MQHVTPKKLAFSYVRMSTEKQIKGDSLRRQVEWSQDYAARNNLELQEKSFRDIGVSAWKGKNRTEGDLGAFIDLVKEGEIPASSYLLVENLDRLSRMTPLDALDLFREILKTGITVVTIGEDEDDIEEVYTNDSLRNNTEQLMATITIMLRANKESVNKSKRIRKAFNKKHELALNGVKTNQKAPGWIDAIKIGKGEFEYRLNSRADDIRWIFEQSAAGVGFAKISKTLNDRGVPVLGKSKKGWWDNTVARIVSSGTAIGEYQRLAEVDGRYVPKGDPIQDFYPAVVSRDLWLRAQKLKSGPRKGGRAGTMFSNLLGDLAVCGHCGSRMYIDNKHGVGRNTYQYLGCSSYHRGHNDPKCSEGKARFRYEHVEKFILDNVQEIGASDFMRIEKVSHEVKALDEQIADATIRIDGFNKQIDRGNRVLLDEGEDALPDLVELVKERTVQRNALKTHIDALQQQRAVLDARSKRSDPASAIAAMRAEWEAPGTDEATRYALRVRCNRAMSDFIDMIRFDSEDCSYTVILFGGLRAYRFYNVPLKRGILTQRPEVVDMTLYVRGAPEQWVSDDARKLREFSEKTS